MEEGTPCRKCGSTKTGSARHGFSYHLARIFGYRLRRCGGCHRLRLIPRHPETKPQLIRAAPQKNPEACPRCGSLDFRRSRRRWYDRVLRRPKMVRCRNCRRRFSGPQISPRPMDSMPAKPA